VFIRDIRRFETGKRLKEFGMVHAALFPADTGGGKLFGQLNAEVDKLEGYVVAQAAGDNATRNGTAAKTAARGTLHTAIKKLMRTARVVVAANGGDEKFQLPKSRSDQRLLAAARAIVQDTTPMRDQILSHNLPATFFEDVTGTIDAFDSAIQSHAAAKESRAATQAEISKSLKTIFAIARKLDAIVANRCEGDAGVLAEWHAARHVSSVTVPYPVRKQPDPPAPTPAPTVSKVA